MLGQYPLLPVAEEVVAGYREQLEAEGWSVQVNAGLPGTVKVELEHPLVPGRHSFGVHSPHMTADGAREFLADSFENYYQFDVVRKAPVRSERERLLRQLRGAAMVWASAAACQAITSAAYTLYEEGVLLQSEAAWLDEALTRDLKEDPRSRT